jgi:hypothetical protein
MKRIVWIVLSLCLAVVPAACADQWSKTFTVSGKPDLRVETSDANIHVDTWDQNSIEAKVTSEHWKIGEGGLQIYDHQTGDSVELEIRFPHSFVTFSTRSYRVDVEIHMPRQGHVNLQTTDGHIRLSNFKGNMEVNSSDGGQDIEGAGLGWTHSRGRPFRRTGTRYQRRPHRSHGAVGIHRDRRLEPPYQRWQHQAAGTGEFCRRRGPAHRGRPHHPGCAGLGAGTAGGEKYPRKTEWGRTPAHHPHWRRIDYTGKIIDSALPCGAAKGRPCNATFVGCPRSCW